MDKLNYIFKAISFFDEVRWNEVANYNVINFCKSELSNDTKIFTHWLCYITDRQMAFERIWDVGGYVFSELIDTIKEKKTIDLLNPDNPNAFIKRIDNGKRYVFVSHSKVNNTSILKKYGFVSSKKVEFSSRYYPSDYFSILYTIVFLEKYNFMLSKFIQEIFEKYSDNDDFIKKLLFSLYLLTYYNVGQPNKNDIIQFKKNLKKAEERRKKLEIIFSKKKEFEEKYKIFLQRDVFHQKRAWCSLRDFLKSPEFNKYFKNALIEVGVTTFKSFSSISALKNLELPGDVWNNNSNFRNCILFETEYEKSNKELNKILRNYYDKHCSEIEGYPEQFDITFDFVPRMCEKNNCDICPVVKGGGKQGTNFKKICISNKKKYCTVAMIACNYKIDCYGGNCELLNLVSEHSHSKFE